MWIEAQNGNWHNSKYIVNLEIVGDTFGYSIFATDINGDVIELFKFNGVSAKYDAKSKLRDVIRYISTD